MTLELWSLYKIMQHYRVDEIAEAINRLHWLECYGARKKDQGEQDFTVSPSFVKEHVETIIKYCHDKCSTIPIEAALERIDGDFGARIASGLMTHGEMRFQVRELRKDILSALTKQQFIFIDPDKVADIRRSIKDWEEIMSAFGFIKQDVDDHHDCYAVGKNNASVFHLMRVVEWGLRALCIHIGFRRIKSKSKATGEVWVTPIEYTVWETMLGQIQMRVDAKLERLRKGSAKQQAQEFYIPLLQDLRAFKDAWRNHVMHNRTSYTPEDVLAVASHVIRFMLALTRKGICKV